MSMTWLNSFSASLLSGELGALNLCVYYSLMIPELISLNVMQLDIAPFFICSEVC